MKGSRGKRIIIVGAGVIGLCTAYYAARRGHQVTVIDRSGPETWGCSHGNAGMVVPSHFVPMAAPGMVALGLKWMFDPESPFYIQPRWNAELLEWGWKFFRASTAGHVRRAAPVLRDLHLASRACFEELASLPGGDFGLAKNGLLMLCRTRHALEEEARMASRAEALGVPATVLDAPALAALEPGVTMSAVGAVYYPRDCHLDPGRFMASLRRWITEFQGEWSWHTEVTDWKVQGGRIVSLTTSRGEMQGDEYVLSAGSWSAAQARALNLSLPMQAGKGYSLTLPNPRQLPHLCSILTEARVAVTPMGGSLRFGGTLEMAGLNTRTNPRRVQGILQAIPHYFPAFTPGDFASVTAWNGLRPCSPDGMPYLGRSSRLANLSLATGHAMMGMSLGPISGQIMAEILSDQSPSQDLSLLNPNRYAS